MRKLFLIIFTCVGLYGQSLYNDQGHIPQSYQLDWFKAGLLSSPPQVADRTFNVKNFGAIGDGVNDDYSAIDAAIDIADNFSSGISIIYFPPGTYKIDSTISLDETQSNIVFQGAGSEETTLNFSVGSTNNCFNISGSLSVGT